MTNKQNPRQARVDEYIDQSLKTVFSELESDEMPDQITDLLNVLRAQDKEMQGKK